MCTLTHFVDDVLLILLTFPDMEFKEKREEKEKAEGEDTQKCCSCLALARFAEGT